MLQLYDLRTEYRENPLGIDAQKPRFSWKLRSDLRDVTQTSYRVVVSTEDRVVWDTGTRVDSTSIAIPYGGEPLTSATVYSIHVCVTDNHEETAEAEGTFETALMSPEAFSAKWITHGFEDDLEPCAVFVKWFSLHGKVKKARLYATALGIYEFSLNDAAVSDVRFAPGWTGYETRLQYQTYDVTDALKSENELRFTVGNGWYKGILGFFNQGNHYGRRTGLLAQLVVTYEDGATETIGTDENWTNTTGEHRYNEIYHGEIIDRSLSEFEAQPVRLLDHTKDILIAQQDEPVRITERIAALEKHVTPKGEVVLDFGQNLTGVVEAHLRGEKGQKVIVRHAEALDENGNFYTVNLRTARCTDTFILSGGEDVFLPSFTYHGFRYIAVEGLGEDIDPACFTACVMHTDLEKTARFETSNPLVNRLAQNIDWGLRDNFLDIPTDCPQRDERLGYTGDTQIFLPTAAILRNVELFYEKYLADLKDEQAKGMGVPTTIPNILGPGGGISIWHDAAAIIPWVLYQNYGDKVVLEKQFDSMVDCVEYYREKLVDDYGLVKTCQELGDWVSMDVPRGPMLKRTEEVWNLELVEKMGATDPYFIANAYYLRSVELTAKAARVLGRDKEAERYEALHAELLGKIRDEYITRNGRLVSETQTGCALALAFGICEEKDRQKLLDAMIANIKLHKNHLTTGFAGTPFLCPTLSDGGAHDVAGTLFLKEDCPSWLYHVRLGATTMWELWDGVNPDGSFNRFEMNSLNHYSYGSIGAWMFHKLLGLDIVEPGYKKSRIAPRLIVGIPEVKGSIETVYGTLACAVSCLDGRYCIDITIPANTTAVVALPERDEETLGSGTYHFEYKTAASFVKLRFNMETPFGELVEHPVGGALLNQYAKALMENELFLMFAKEHSVQEVLGMLPAEIKPLIDMVLDQCNAAVSKP